MDHLSAGQNVLVIWKTTGESSDLQKQVELLKSKVEPGGKVSLENAARLKLSEHGMSTFDIVLSGVLFPHSVTHDVELLGEILRVVKPTGQLVVQEATGDGRQSTAQLLQTLSLSGFTSCSEPKQVSLTSQQVAALQAEFGTMGDGTLAVVEITCQKPNFEVGSSVPLRFGKPKPVPADVAAVWKLDDNVEEDLVDPDSLLDEEDLKKPDPASLRVCGTTGKRKACKDCSCGLAEELSGQKDAQPAQTKASSCGSCYLGDAFRCATCPYLGMPAFKPGEKISLSDNQLRADV